jgi:hypothetical protein
MRAHPDRFRGQASSIRKNQANLLSALSERMGAQDFLDYTTNTANSSHKGGFQAASQKYDYVLEKRDGSLVHLNLQLDNSVESLLNNMARALKLSGAASLPPPPSSPCPIEGDAVLPLNQLVWASSSKNSQIDHRFDVNTTKGRDLWSFLRSIDKDQVEERRAFRMDASAAALVARRLYSFQAIDGISLGWSSKSFAVLLNSLINLHEEHSSRFHVDSFYPLRLVFSHDDIQESLDVYGGTIFLHPGSTPIQCLSSLQKVTPERLEEFQHNRMLLEERTLLVQHSLGVKIKRGHSCSSKAYHIFIERLSRSLAPVVKNDQQSQSLAIEQLLVHVESSQVSRRSRCNKDGSISVNTGMSEEEMVRTISRLSHSARELLVQGKDERERSKQAIHQIQWELGLHKVYRTNGIVSHNEFVGALSRMLEQRQKLKGWLSGYSLGIAGSGHFCSLADDGSLVIPLDWQ